MAFLSPGIRLSVRRVFTGGLVAMIGCVAAAAADATAAPPSRAERIAIRRLERIEVLERRAEAAAEMPPRPADVRRMLRRGVPLSEIMAKDGMARAAQPVAPPARAAVPTPPSPPTTAARPTAPPRPFAAAPATPAAASAGEPALRFPEQQATAIDDGTRSVLMREEPTPAPPTELLPTPQPKK